MSKHLFHMLPYSPWPILSSMSAFFVVSGLAFYMHKVNFGGWFFIFGLICLILCAFGWLSDIVDEATFSGYHTKAVSSGLSLGFMLFMISEFMLFFGFFWAFFHAAICPAVEMGSQFPPVGIQVMDPLGFPLFNTFVLMISGFSVTWAHRAVSLGWFKDAMDSLFLTIFLGFFFVILQMFEYYEATFSFADSVYSCSFYMLTGLHGCHVIAGACFLLVSLMRLMKRHNLKTHYTGFVFAMWYWHFVDVVWIFLFLSVYCWGSWA